MTWSGNNYENMLRGDNSTNLQGRIMGSALPLMAIYLYTKFY